MDEARYVAQFILDNSANVKHISGIAEMSIYDNFDETIWLVLSKEVYDYLKENIDTPNGIKSKYFVAMNLYNIDTVDQLQKVDDSAFGMAGEDISFDVWKSYYRNRMVEILTTRTALYPYKLFKFLKLFNVFAANGYFITDENREEKYIDIITNHEELIDTLSEYLDVMDNLNEENGILTQYDTYHTELEGCKTKEELEEVFNKFSADYNS